MKKLKKLAGTLLAIILAGSVPAHDATYVDASVLADANVEYTGEHDHDTCDVFGMVDHCHDDHDCDEYAGAGIKIALLDAGVSEFETKKSVSFVGEKNEGSAHGNSMAAILMSQVPEADIYDVKVLDDEGHGTYSSVVAGINWAIENGADIISMSFVGTERSALLEDALVRAYEAGILVVAAAGNYSDTEKVYPAAYPTVLAVGAVNELGQTTYSNYGDYVDAYVLWDNGTSGAAQSIAGTAAYILGTEPGITVDQLFARFSSSVPEVLEKFDADNADTIVYACDSCLNYHYWGSWNVTRDSTCYSTGTKERKCNRCGKVEKEVIPVKSHVSKNVTDVDSTCTKTGTGHAECTLCGKTLAGYQIAAKGHNFGGWTTTAAATCTSNGTQQRTCSRCGTKETQTITAPGHSFGSWTTTTAATCTSNGTQQRTCSRCGGKETLTITAPGHSFGSWTTTTAATCTSNGTQQRTCSRCGGKETKTITAPGHSFGSWTTTKTATCTTDGTKERTCSICGAKETATIKSPGGHRWDSWKVTTANSCGKDGVETRVCLTCNQKETRTLPATGLHTPHGNYKITKAATCTTAGSKYLVCDTCGANCGTTTIPALGHSFGNWTTTKAATCTANGTKQRTCSRCGVVETGTITKLGHAFGSWTTITKATCTTNGTKRRTCSKCGTVETATIQSPGGHKWDSWKVTTPNNCGKNGVETRVCLTCNQKETRTLPATGLHTPHGNYKITKAATCTTAGSKYLVCDTCGANCGTSVIPALGHDYGSWTTIKQATCTADGSKKHTCGRCGYTETVTIKSPGGHKWDSWKVTTPNNCGKDGVETRVCLTCNQKETRTIPATGLHTPHGNFKIIKAATCTTDGSKYLVCDTCGANCGTSVIPALGHKMGEWITVKSRTCTTDGTEKRVCERCDYTETRTVKSPGGHKWDSWKETTPVSCETDGVETRICLECREKQTRAIKHTGHVPGEWELVTEPTTKKPGEKVLKCTKCKEKLETKKVILIKLTGADSLDPICRDSGSTFGTLPTPSKPGYVFEGWVDARNTSKFVSANDTVSSSTSITLKAIWTLRSYTIRFEANRGGGSGNGSVDDISIKYGDDVRMPRNTYSCNISERPYSSPNFETIPQEFVGWSTTKDGTGAIFAEGQNIDSDILTACGAMSDGSVIPLYAIWRPSRPVTSDGGYTYTLTSWIIPNTTQDIRFDFGELLNGLPCGYRISIDAPSVIHTTWKNGDYIIPRMHNQSVQDMNRLQLTYIQETKNDVPVKYTITFTSDRGMTLDGNTSVVWVSSPHLMPDGFRVVEVYVCKDDLNHYLNAMEWADAEKTAKVTHENLQEAIIKRIQALGELEAKKFMKWLIPKYTLIDFCYKTVKEIAQGVSADNTFISPHDSVKWLTQKVEIANLCTPAKLDFELNGVGVELPFWSVDYGVHFTFVCDCKNTGEELFDPGHYFKISPERNNYLEAWDGMSISLRPGACGEFIVGRVAERDDQFFEKMLAKMTYPELKGVKENDIENGQYFLFDLGTFNKAK